ncbi:MAG TPA: hypothetical protein VKD72_37660 [Gemmataceae bacterium]|nr:hypothetical protein [Gemmataceae bacterium]
MLRNPLFLALLASLATLLTSARAQAWGAFHAGYTHFGPGGFYHVGRTAVGGYGGWGGIGGYHYGYGGYHYGGFGGYHYGYGVPFGGAYEVGGYHYSPAYYGDYGGAHVGVYAEGYRGGWIP